MPGITDIFNDGDSVRQYVGNSIICYNKSNTGIIFTKACTESENGSTVSVAISPQ